MPGPKSNTAPVIYGHWELMLPQLPVRSDLYQIRPIGIGTPEAECLTSHLARLSNAHQLSVGTLLLQYLIPQMNGKLVDGVQPLSTGVLFKMVSANGTGGLAATLIRTIEQLTLITGLEGTTLIPWGNLIPPRELLRAYRAWCAACYCEQLESGSLVYDQLLWMILPINICLRHHCPLSMNCPRCLKKIRPIMTHYLPGYCSYCQAWLGHTDAEAASDEKPAIIDDLHYELWKASNVGKIVEASPNMPGMPTRTSVSVAINHLCNMAAEGNPTILARLLDVGFSSVHRWIQGKAMPAIKPLLRLSYLTGVPLIELLTSPEFVSEYLSTNPVDLGRERPKQIRHFHRQHPQACTKVRLALEAALMEIPQPTLLEVARRVGYRHSGTLRIKFPELSKRISANYKLSERYRQVRRTRCTKANRPDKDAQRKALEQELNKPNPSTLRELSRKFGYADGSTLIIRFPELTRALTEKRRQLARQRLEERLNQCRNILKNSLTEEPPPTLRSVIRRMAGGGEHFLRRHFPKECRDISHRQIDYQRKRMLAAKYRLQQSLSEVPPRTFNQLVKESGYNFKTLRDRFPDLFRLIMSRYDKYRTTLKTITHEAE